jgi:hypothetical protein
MEINLDLMDHDLKEPVGWCWRHEPDGLFSGNQPTWFLKKDLGLKEQSQGTIL